MLQGTNKEKLREHRNIGKNGREQRNKDPVGDPQKKNKTFYQNIIQYEAVQCNVLQYFKGISHPLRPSAPGWL